jgi:hypothetical protein
VIPSTRLEPDLARGGLIFEIWLAGKRIHRDLLPEIEGFSDGSIDSRTQAAIDSAIERLESLPGAHLLVYDGDDGRLISITTP